MVDMIDIKGDCKSRQRIRFKKNKFNEMLMSYIRSCFVSPFEQDMKEANQKCDRLLLTRIVNLEFERYCLNRYEEIVVAMEKYLTQKTTLK